MKSVVVMIKVKTVPVPVVPKTHSKMGAYGGAFDSPGKGNRALHADSLPLARPG